MLDLDAATDAIVAALAAIPELAAAITAQGQVQIKGFHYLQGEEQTLSEAVYSMRSPSMLVAWRGTRGGNFNGYTVWKHTWSVFYRMGNAAGAPSPVSYAALWRLTCDGIPTGFDQNIRYTQLYPGLDIMDTPTVAHAMDPSQIDYFEGTFVIPEIGDN